MQVPPLQWINLSSLTKGATPPPLRDCTIGYDELTRNLIIFGGVSSSDGLFASDQTYLLNLDTLVWSLSSPAPGLPSTVQTSPPARSRAQGGSDTSANSRRSWFIWGGRASDGLALNDLWSYDFQFQFWVQDQAANSGPSALWGSAGGSDLTLPIRVPNPPNFQNNFTFFGGVNPSAPSQLSDAWRLTLDGSLSSNVQSVEATWTELKWPHSLPAMVGEASAVLPGGVVAVYGGCNQSFPGGVYNASCAQQSAFVLDPQVTSTLEPTGCPPPRFDGSLTPNYNKASQSFTSQVFLMFGLFDENQWDDGGGSSEGEVAVLDTSSSLWSRLLPSGDPGQQSTQPTFPSSRSGAAVLSYPQALVGSNRDASSDSIVFGGQQANSEDLLNDIWILRAYNGVVSTNGGGWDGFGSGRLQSGIDADGQGVKTTYLNACARRIAVATPSPATVPKPTSSSTSPVVPPSIPRTGIDTSTLHKIFAPISTGLILASLAVYTLSSSLVVHDKPPASGLLYFAFTSILSSFVFALIAIVIGLQSTRVLEQQISKRDQLAFHSSHAVIGLAFMVCFYGILVAYVVWIFSSRGSGISYTLVATEQDRLFKPSPLTSRLRTRSMGSSSLRDSPWSESETHSTSPPQVSPGFQVVNRPRHLRASTSPAHYNGHHSHVTVGDATLPRTLSNLSWLDRRRSLNAVGELDFTMSQIVRPSVTEHDMASSLPNNHLEKPSPPSQPRSVSNMVGIILLALFHACLLAVTVFTLISLWTTQKRIPFIIFTIYSILVYAFIFWRALKLLHPSSTSQSPHYISTPLLSHKPICRPSFATMEDYSAAQDNVADHQTVRSSTLLHGGSSIMERAPSHNLYPASVEEAMEDEEDDTDKQHRMEQEMHRRDVSIVTVPRRTLRVANM